MCAEGGANAGGKCWFKATKMVGNLYWEQRPLVDWMSEMKVFAGSIYMCITLSNLVIWSKKISEGSRNGKLIAIKWASEHHLVLKHFSLYTDKDIKNVQYI